MKSKQAAFDFIAAFLILAQPYVEFAYTNRFNMEAANIVILGAFAGFAVIVALVMSLVPNRHFRSAVWTVLIVLFLDARVDIFKLIGFNALLIVPVIYFAVWFLHLRATALLTAVFGAILAGIVLLPVFPLTQTFEATASTSNDHPGGLPTYVHIILDEQGGIETLGEETDIQRTYIQSVKDLFQNNGFRLFGRAYSEYYDTYDSMSAAFNTYRGLEPSQFYEYNSKENLYALKDNPYFNNLSEEGYNIHVYQTSFVNYCKRSTNVIRKCVTYKPFGIASDALAQLTTIEKVDLVSSLFGFFYANGVIHRVYTKLVAFGARLGIPIPDWELVPPTDLGPIPVLPVFDQLISDVVSAPDGTMFLAHLLIPHQPYSVDANCDIRRPVGQWNKALPRVAQDDGSRNTTVSRFERYAEYIDQATCALAKIEELIEAMKSAGKFENSVIIVHGDHGSRIARRTPRLPHREQLSREDYFDGFSILFAVKAPQVTPGYDLRMLSLEQLLRWHSRGDAAIALEEPEEHFVYLREEPPDGQNYFRAPMPEIPGGPTGPPRVNNQSNR